MKNGPETVCCNRPNFGQNKQLDRKGPIIIKGYLVENRKAG